MHLTESPLAGRTVSGTATFPEGSTAWGAPRQTRARATIRRWYPSSGEDALNKSELSSQVADQASLSKGQASDVVDAVFSAIADALARDESVAIPGFGTFSTKARAAREGRNPRTGESIAIAASKSPSFKAGKTLRDAMRG